MKFKLKDVDQILHFAISLAIMRYFRHMDTRNKLLLWFIRTVYGISQLIYFIALFKIYTLIHNKIDVRTLPPQLNTLDKEEEDKIYGIIYTEYDIREFNKIYKNAKIHLLVVSLLHWKWGFVHPLIMQSVIAMKSFCLNPLFMAYLFGKNIARPFEEHVLYQSSGETIKSKSEKVN
ncbi:hypothetical protein TCON_0828 [Astathelohania contejeani]|uniref:Uncharacterized protein n=1 Tax=Astathelohania contejeani TaxID=164912 RepID=A0ABQ7I0Q3_9MICR|nr:hypothetical protein TCON_0828 [Thelohania contejeani]